MGGLKKVTKKYGALIDSTRLQNHYHKKNGEQVAYARKIFMEHERSIHKSTVRGPRQGSLGRQIRKKAEYTRDMEEANYIGELMELQQANNTARPQTAPSMNSSRKKSKKRTNSGSRSKKFPGERIANETDEEVTEPKLSTALDEYSTQN